MSCSEVCIVLELGMRLCLLIYKSVIRLYVSYGILGCILLIMLPRLWISTPNAYGCACENDDYRDSCDYP